MCRCERAGDTQKQVGLRFKMLTPSCPSSQAEPVRGIGILENSRGFASQQQLASAMNTSAKSKPFQSKPCHLFDTEFGSSLIAVCSPQLATWQLVPQPCGLPVLEHRQTVAVSSPAADPGCCWNRPCGPCRLGTCRAWLEVGSAYPSYLSCHLPCDLFHLCICTGECKSPILFHSIINRDIMLPTKQMLCRLLAAVMMAVKATACICDEQDDSCSRQVLLHCLQSC